MLSLHCSILFSFTLITVSHHVCGALGDASFKGMSPTILASGNRIPNSVLCWDLFLVEVEYVLGFNTIGMLRFEVADVRILQLFEDH